MLFILSLYFFPLPRDRFYHKKSPRDFTDFLFYTTPCANMASATFTKPAMFAPFT